MSKRFLAKAASFSILLFASAAYAADDQACDGSGNMLQMTQCAVDGYNKADAELNKIYKRIIAEAKTRDKESEDPTGWPGYEDSLRRSERAWTKYRDEECYLKTLDNKGGSLRKMEYPACLEQMTKDRMKELTDTWDEPAPAAK